MTFKGSGFLGFGGAGNGAASPVNIDLADFEQVLDWNGLVTPHQTGRIQLAAFQGTRSNADYDSTNKRWRLSRAGGLRLDRNRPFLDFQNLSLILRLRMTAGYDCMAYWMSNVPNDQQSDWATWATGSGQGQGVYIGSKAGRYSASHMTATFWNIGIQSEVANKWIDDFTISDIDGVLKTADGNTTLPRTYVQIPRTILGDGPHDFVLQMFDKKVKLFINDVEYAEFNFTDAEWAAFDGARANFGIFPIERAHSSDLTVGTDLYYYGLGYPAKAFF